MAGKDPCWRAWQQVGHREWRLWGAYTVPARRAADRRARLFPMHRLEAAHQRPEGLLLLSLHIAIRDGCINHGLHAPQLDINFCLPHREIESGPRGLQELHPAALKAVATSPRRRTARPAVEFGSPLDYAQTHNMNDTAANKPYPVVPLPLLSVKLYCL